MQHFFGCRQLLNYQTECNILKTPLAHTNHPTVLPLLIISSPPPPPPLKADTAHTCAPGVSLSLLWLPTRQRSIAFEWVGGPSVGISASFKTRAFSFGRQTQQVTRFSASVWECGAHKTKSAGRKFGIREENFATKRWTTTWQSLPSVLLDLLSALA